MEGGSHISAVPDISSDKVRRILGRNPIALECARAASGFTGRDAEVVVLEDDRVFVAASVSPANVMLPRKMHATERLIATQASLGAGAGHAPEASIFEGSVSIPILDTSGYPVAALTVVLEHERSIPNDDQLDGLMALGRVLRAELIAGQEDGDFFHRLVQGQRDAVIVLDGDLNVKWASAAMVSLLALSPSEVIGMSAANLLHPDDLEGAFDAVATLAQGLAITKVPVRLRSGDGTYNPVDVTGTDLSTDPLIGGFVLNVRDAHHDEERDAEIDRTRRLAQGIVGSLRDGLVATDRFGAVTLVNTIARDMFGIDDGRTPAQLSLDDFVLTTVTGDPHDPLKTSNQATLCLLNRFSTVSFVSCLTQAIADADGDDAGYVIVFSDVTEEHRAAEKLRTQALQDPLTGFANRRQLDQRLRNLEQSTSDQHVGACFIDLDGFKFVNDNHGHRIGDQLIRVAAERLASELRDGDLLARQGGDEFVAVLDNVTDMAEAIATAERCRAELSRPYLIGSERFDLTASAGVAVSGDGPVDGDHLLRCADIALHAAKEAGRNRVVAFEHALAEAVDVEHAQRRFLRNALDNRRIQMHFQPLVDATTELTKEYEALARIDPGDGTLISPSTFLDAIANSGLMWELDQQAFEISCQAILELVKIDPTASPRIACNFSPVSLSRADFVEFITTTTESLGVRPDQLCIELTETAAFTSGPHTNATLSALAELGYELALDDFGTGYSSLAHLRDLPISIVKVDRSFVSKLASDDSERAIAEAIATLARNLGLGLVAEGVETEAQLEQARLLGFQTIQGWHFAPALPLDECLADWARTVAAKVPESANEDR